MIDWQIFFILSGLSLWGMVSIVPFTLTLQRDVIKGLSRKFLAKRIFLQVLKGIPFYSAAIIIGMLLVPTTGFALPVFESAVHAGDILARLGGIWPLSLAIGVTAGVLVLVLDGVFATAGARIVVKARPPLWQGLLACFYGAVCEEILFRWGIMAVLAGGFRLLGLGVAPAMWSALLLTTGIFGLMHLPLTKSLTTLTPLIILRALVLNGVSGAGFGWIFWKNGLEAAMLAHFSADLVLYVMLPALARRAPRTNEDSAH